MPAEKLSHGAGRDPPAYPFFPTASFNARRSPSMSTPSLFAVVSIAAPPPQQESTLYSLNTLIVWGCFLMTSLMIMSRVIVSMLSLPSFLFFSSFPSDRFAPPARSGPGGDHRHHDGLFGSLEPVRFVGLGDDEVPGLRRLLAAPRDEGALPLDDVEHDVRRRRVRRDLLPRHEPEDDDAHRLGVVQELGDGPVRREPRLLHRVEHGIPRSFFPSGRRHRLARHRLATPSRIPANCATLPAQRSAAAAGTMQPRTIPAVASVAIQKCAAAHVSLRSGFPAKRGRMWYAMPKMIMMTKPVRLRCVCASLHCAPGASPYRKSRVTGRASRVPSSVPRTK